MKLLRSLTSSVAFYGKFAKPSEFLNFQKNFQENHFIFLKTREIWTFSEVSLIRLHSTDYFVSTKSTIESFGNFTNSVAFHDKFATFTDIWKNQVLFQKIHQLSFLKKLNVHRNPNISVTFYDKFASYF